MELGHQLHDYVKTKNLGEIVTEVGFVLARDPDLVLAPDIAFITKEDVPVAKLKTRFVDDAPILAVEVLSPWAVSKDIDRKVQLYLEKGSKGFLLERIFSLIYLEYSFGLNPR